MSLASDLERALGERDPEGFLEEAAMRIRTEPPEELIDAAEWAVRRSQSLLDSPRYGPVAMVAGAARAKAAELRERPEPAQEAELLRAFADLQRRIDRGEPVDRALESFGSLGARLLVSSVSPVFDMKVPTTEDDSVFHWVSGVMWLKRG